MESPWSESIQVQVINNQPTKPNKPDGPTEGKPGTSYQYRTYSNDSEGHLIKYGWDWNGDRVVDDWTDLFESGVEVTSSNSWYEEGTYSIRVKAQDEYGEESDWSEPLTISLPKYRMITKIHLIDLLIEKIPILRNIFIAFSIN